MAIIDKFKREVREEDIARRYNRSTLMIRIILKKEEQIKSVTTAKYVFKLSLSNGNLSTKGGENSFSRVSKNSN